MPMSIQPTLLNKGLLCLLLAYAAPVFAVQGDVEQPLSIEADTAVFDRNKGTATYDGNVIVKQGTLEILAAHVDILAPENEIQQVIATGSPVNFKQEMDNKKLAKGKSTKMEYFVSDKRLVLTGESELEQDQDKLTGNSIVYLIDSGEIVADGKGGKSGRITATFFPSKAAE
ncbi:MULTISPECIES: lipopolysaccharide transport periplasmic protein LptA [Thiothrix]|nr:MULTISPECIES: lipopolysaccharide transport periplasmic protein LptA [Thiothrix]MDX9987903.1 lipopolysaccharide transport periplasmic protein LptA [Thiothrix unzii]